MTRRLKPASIEDADVSGQTPVLRSDRKADVLPFLAGQELRRFRRALLGWYDTNRRDLPWRRTRDPYAIWLSEIMLQQTRVAAVLEHYQNFLQRFPDVAALAVAAEDAVLAAWSGLGYYRRARMLPLCAREIMDHHGGRFPETAADLHALPGIGRYTAAAIASIAFQEPDALVDGNVERVLQRLGGSYLPLRQIWQRAQRLLSASRPGDFNQAMMELGATVCLPREPRCAVCPIGRWCASRGALEQKKSVSRQERRQMWCALERRNGHLRMMQRSKTASLMAGMWELPQWADPPHTDARYLLWRTFRHSITVTDYTVHVLRKTRLRSSKIAGSQSSKKSELPPGRGKWVAIREIPELPLTGLTRKILKADGII